MSDPNQQTGAQKLNEEDVLDNDDELIPRNERESAMLERAKYFTGITKAEILNTLREMRKPEPTPEEVQKSELQRKLNSIQKSLEEFHDENFKQTFLNRVEQILQADKTEIVRRLTALVSIATSCSWITEVFKLGKSRLYIARIKAFFQTQKNFLLSILEEDDFNALDAGARRFQTLVVPLTNDTENAKKYYRGIAYGISPEKFLGISAINFDQTQIDHFLTGNLEVGGVVDSKRQDDSILLDFRHTTTGDETSIAVKQDLFTPKELALWHSHPREKGIPLPSGDDLFNPYFLFSTQPNAILTKNGSRLYLPAVYVAMLDEELAAKFTRFEPEDRKRELLRYGWSEKSIEYANQLSQGLYYLDLV